MTVDEYVFKIVLLCMCLKTVLDGMFENRT